MVGEEIVYKEDPIICPYCGVDQSKIAGEYVDLGVELCEGCDREFTVIPQGNDTVKVIFN